jgi:hypothetical protein
MQSASASVRDSVHEQLGLLGIFRSAQSRAVALSGESTWATSEFLFYRACNTFGINAVPVPAISHCLTRPLALDLTVVRPPELMLIVSSIAMLGVMTTAAAADRIQSHAPL